MLPNRQMLLSRRGHLLHAAPGFTKAVIRGFGNAFAFATGCVIRQGRKYGMTVVLVGRRTLLQTCLGILSAVMEYLA